MRAVLLLIGAPVVLAAQVPTIRLSAPDARLAHEFSDLVTIREMADGRLLLSDRREERLVVADLGSGRVRDVARKGRGPGEFESFVLKLLPLGGDSTLAADMNRWLVLVGDSVVATLPPDLPAKRAVSLWPLGAGAGRLLTRLFGRADPPGVALVDRRDGASDTIGVLHFSAGPRAEARAGRAPDGRVGVSVGRVPLRVQDQPMLFHDGWVAIARVNPYRVDWRSPDGRWTSGAPLPFTPVRMNAREQQTYGDRFTWSRNMTAWPEFMPPFDDAAQVFPSPEGMLVIRRAATASRPETRYDVVDRSGRLRGEIVLPRHQHIIGFGAQSVYVVETDDDGIQRVGRHAWPMDRLRG